MESLRKLEEVQKMVTFVQLRGLASGHSDSDRFLAQFFLFMVQSCGTLNMEEKCHLISENLSRIPTSVLEEAEVIFTDEDCPQGNGNIRPEHDQRHELRICHLETNLENEAMIGLDAMERASSTLEDFCRSYFMFHGMDVNDPRTIFKYLPILSFTESYIYQLDALNERILNLSTNGAHDLCKEGNQGRIKHIIEAFQCDPFEPLYNLLDKLGTLTERLREELKCGIEYWTLERKLCQALSTRKRISIEDVMRAIHLKSFDYRVLNLMLYQLRKQPVNEEHMEFLSTSEFLVEISDDFALDKPIGIYHRAQHLTRFICQARYPELKDDISRYDYEDDVLENNFNVLRMFVGLYGASAAHMLAKVISEAEEKYDRLSKNLPPELSQQYWRRCEEATQEGGRTTGHRLGTWNIPQVIVDEELYRARVLKST